MIPTMPHVNRDSFEQAALPHRPSLYGLAFRLTRRPDLADDLVQDTYLRAYRAFHTFEPGTNLRAWLFQILRNAFINQYRADKSRGAGVEVHSLESFTEDRLQSAATAASPDTDPESIVMSTILPIEIHTALEELPPTFREAVTCAFIDELSYQEIAERVGVPIGTVMSRIYRGRKMLQERLREFAVARRLVGAELGDGRMVA